MLHEQIQAALVAGESVPWLPFTPHSEEVLLKYFKVDPIRGETIMLIKAPAGARLPRHHCSGTALVYTLEGQWKYVEQDWIAGPGSVVCAPAASCSTPLVLGDDGHALVLAIVAGDLVFLDDDGRVQSIENWKTAVRRYESYCEASGILPRDLTAFH